MEEYITPEVRMLGTFASLTMGQNGSCPDGGGENDQLGGGSIEGETSVECGPGTGGSD